jgi:hypothetical protein
LLTTPLPASATPTAAADVIVPSLLTVALPSALSTASMPAPLAVSVPLLVTVSGLPCAETTIGPTTLIAIVCPLPPSRSAGPGPVGRAGRC